MGRERAFDPRQGSLAAAGFYWIKNHTEPGAPSRKQTTVDTILHCFGAAGCVTGSCFLLETANANVLIECGLFQGTKTLKELNYRPFPFDPSSIDAVLLSHAHIDHSGLLPKLALAGYAGPIFATAGTRELCEVMLPDCGVIQEIEVEQLNRRNRRRARAPLQPIFTANDARDTLRLFRSVELKAWTPVANGVRARWWNAGHILGSASIEIEVANAGQGRPLRLCFSGDIGPGGRDLADDPEGPRNIDHLIVESTYGAVERQNLGVRARRAELCGLLRAAHDAGGPVLIPAFAVERTQELLVDLLELMRSGEVPSGPIFLDSPLAIKACDVFFRMGDLQSGLNPFDALRESELLRFTESAAESRDLERQRGWHIVIAASGMCDAGRVRGHLRRLLPRKEATVLIVGYQAIGTLGSLLLEGRREVRIQGDEVTVNARIQKTDVYSGHADAIGLTNWIKARKPISGSVFLVHGEAANLLALRERLAAAGFPIDRINIPHLDQSYRLLPSSSAAAPEAASRIPASAVGRLDWHNARIELLNALQKALDHAPNDAAREALLSRLARQLDGAP